MIYRLLGGVSMLVGAVFGLIALAVLIPFLNSFSGSLLILVAVFGILAWVFLAIGWQLLRPPRRAAESGPKASWGPEHETGSSPEAGSASVGEPSNGAGGAAAMSGEAASADAEPAILALGSSFSSFDVAATVVDEQSEHEQAESPEATGLSIDERLTATTASFKKPYRAPDEAGRADE